MRHLYGQKFGRLTVIDRAPNIKTHSNKTGWNCVCDCGTKKIVATAQLVNGRTKSCGCWKRELANSYRRLRPYEATFNVVRGVARNYNHEFSITYDDYITLIENNKVCHYCDDIIPWQPFCAGKSNAYYLDRKDNNIGYTKENCVVCCSRCNKGKGYYFSYEEWVVIGKTIKEYRECPLNLL